MRFIFLGTGTSSGVPAIACDCPTCTSEDPRDRRTRTGACVQWTDGAGRDRVVLIDTTPDLREQALRHRLQRCDAILYTHNHVDHVFGLDEVRRFNAVMQAPIDIYAEKHTMDSLKRVYQHVFDAKNNINKSSFVATLIPHVIEPDHPLDLWGLRFTPFRLMHGRLPILGWRIERAAGAGRDQSPERERRVGEGAGAQEESSDKELSNDHGANTTGARASGSDGWLPLAYCTDVSAFPPDAWGKLTGLRTLVLDALRWRHHPTHLTIDQAVDTAEQIGAERTWFVHMAHQVKHSETQEKLPQGVGLAWDGLTLE